MAHKGSGIMDLNETAEIRLLVNDERDLYDSFNPETEFNSRVKTYIRDKAGAEYRKSLRLIVISSDQIDEEKFRKAVANWVSEEKETFNREAKLNRIMMAGLLAVASLFIILSLVLSKRVNVLSYTIIPVLGSVALGKAAGMFLIDMPINNTKMGLIREIEKNNTIIFERKSQIS